MTKSRIAITLIFFVMALAYSVITPIFEVSDEIRHYPVIDYIADHGRLPVQDKNRPNAWDWEAAQPPLYYALSALIVAPFDRSDLDQYLQPNPHTKSGIGLASDNQNLALHDWSAEKFPWRGTPLHVHLVRFFSVLLGTWAVWMSFDVARLTVPQMPGVALVAMCLTAFNPMFLAIVGSVNNDNLVIALAPTGLVVMLTLWRSGFTWARVWLLALIGTLAAASKVSGAIVLIPAGLMIALVVWRDKLPRWYIPASALIFIGVCGVLFGWWYVRNLDLYNDLLGNRHMAETVGLREEPITVLDVIRHERGSFFYAYWGWLGGLSILAPQNLFNYAGALWLLALVGWAYPYPPTPSPVHRGRRVNKVLPLLAGEGFRIGVPLVILLFTLLLALYGLISWTLITPATQGRLLFPFAAIISTLTAIGLVRLFGSRWAGYLTAPLLVYAVMCVFWVIPQAFRLPDQLDSLPDSATSIAVRYGGIELVGYEIASTPITPDDQLAVVLYWRALDQTADPLSFYVQVYAPDAAEVGKIDSYPGRGLLRTDTWETGIIYQDEYWLDLENVTDAMLPFTPRLKIGWRDNATGEEIAAVDAAGNPIDEVLVRGGAVSGGDVAFASEGDIVYGGAIRLHHYEITIQPDSLILEVVWESLIDIQEDFSVFVQLVEPGMIRPALAFGDSAPRDEWWQTSAWIPGETFRDQYRVDLSGIEPGQYDLLVGFYRPADSTRLPINQPPYADALKIPVDIN